MNIIEILKKKDTNKKYITNYKGEEMIVRVVECRGGNYDLVIVPKDDEEDYMGRYLINIMYMSEIINMEFEEIFDWSKMPVDTKVLVSSDGKDWYRRHFAEYKDGKVYCFNSGTTSFTAQGSEFPSGKVSWEYVKLYEE